MNGGLHILPNRSDSAAANMAMDFLLLRRYPAAQTGAARFRAYGWSRPSFSFGYSQKFDQVCACLPADAADADRVRRPTGGGVVDHRDDWTYALVLPRGHRLETARAVESYRAVHVALAAALVRAGQAAVLQERCLPRVGAEANEATACVPGRSPGVCFTRPEWFDVMHPESGEKIAGAAQKRTKEGLLLQGSIWRPAASAVRDWAGFEMLLVAELETLLGETVRETPWPDFAEGELEALTEHYASAEWTAAR